MIKTLRLTLPSLMAALLLAGLPGVIQANAGASGTIKGRVLDANSGALSGAHVYLRNATGQSVAWAITNSEGQFQFQTVPPGSYSIFAEADGFAQASEESSSAIHSSSIQTSSRLVLGR